MCEPSLTSPGGEVQHKRKCASFRYLQLSLKSDNSVQAHAALQWLPQRIIPGNNVAKIVTQKVIGVGETGCRMRIPPVERYPRLWISGSDGFRLVPIAEQMLGLLEQQLGMVAVTGRQNANRQRR